MNASNRYTRMQQQQYEAEAHQWSMENRNPVVGPFDEHNAWPDYDLLFRGMPTEESIALDFGCGPGRNIVRYMHRFKQIDGVDISAKNIENAKIWCDAFDQTACRLYQNDGISLSGISSNTYDVVFSTICLQHICVHSIRMGLMKEFLRVLRPGGWFTAQMGYGGQRKNSLPYHANYIKAAMSNGAFDTRVEHPDELRLDLEATGFTDFSSILRPTGPGDLHEQWIFFRAMKGRDHE